MKYADLHSHTTLCNHACGTPDEYLKYAQERNLAFFGVSDHIPWPVGYYSEVRMKETEFPLYRQIVRDLQKKAAGSGTEVLYGIELDYVPGRMDEVAKAIENEPFDYRIGSIHYVSFGFDDEATLPLWESEGPDYVWYTYADLMCEFVNSFDFDIMAHPDLPKKFALYPSDMNRFHKRLEEALKVAGEKGIAMEINTAGLRKKVHELYPSLEILKMAKAAGMPLTFGSDSHAPEDVGADFDLARELAEEAGYRSILTFRNRQPVELPFS